MTKLGLGWSVVTVLVLAGCTTSVEVGTETGGNIQDPEGSEIVASDGGGGAAATTSTQSATQSSAGAGGAPPSSGSVVPGPEIACAEHARTILIRTQHQEMVRFDPVTHAVTPVADVPCLVDTLAVARDGTWLTTVASGMVRRVDPITLGCTDVADPSAGAPVFRFVDIGVARDDGDGPEEKLWVASMEMNGLGPTQLASVDLGTGAVHVVGVVGDGEFIQMALTGTADGRLIGLGVTQPDPAGGTNTFVVDIDRTDGSVRRKTPVDAWQIDPELSSLATAFWGDALFIFLGNTEGTAPYSSVVRHMLDGSAPDTVVATIDGAVMRAASTPCDAIAAL